MSDDSKLETQDEEINESEIKKRLKSKDSEIIVFKNKNIDKEFND